MSSSGDDSDGSNARSKWIEIYIDMSTCETYTLELDPYEWVENVKVRIQTQGPNYDGVPPERQTLYFNGYKLEDRRTLAYYNIKSGAQCFCEVD